MERRKILLILLTLILVAGFLLRLFPVRTGYHYWDETVYLQQGEILAGESPNNYNEFDFRPPLFSLILGSIFLVNSSLVAAHLVVALLSTFGILATYFVAEQLYGRQTGVLASLIYALSPLAIKMSHEILVDAILPVLWLLSAFFLLKAVKSDRSVYYGLTGAMAALAVLMKFTSLMMMPGLAVLLLLYELNDKKLNFQSLLESVYSSFKSRNNWILLTAFLATLSPYMVWSFIEFGSPISVFFNAWQVSGARDAFMTYAQGWSVYLLPPFYLGLVFFIWRSKIESFEDMFPVAFFLILFLPLQFIIANKETRFLLPVIPFLSIISAAGFNKLRNMDDIWRKGTTALFVILLIISVLMVPDKLSGRNPLQDGLEKDGWHPPIEDSARWLKENTPNDTIVYTNYRYPPLGYYSKRKIKWVSPADNLDKLVEDYITEPGYVYYSNKSPHQHPSFEELKEDPRFQLSKSFENTVYLFYFTGVSQ
jgi:4-amino-4-deoxy-L-arabinose transferase-like glycosyltransferase